MAGCLPYPQVSVATLSGKSDRRLVGLFDEGNPIFDGDYLKTVAQGRRVVLDTLMMRDRVVHGAPIYGQSMHLSCESAAAASAVKCWGGDGVPRCRDLELGIAGSLYSADGPSGGFLGAINGYGAVSGFAPAVERRLKEVSPELWRMTGAGYGANNGPIAGAVNESYGSVVTAEATNLTPGQLVKEVRGGACVLVWLINSRSRKSGNAPNGESLWLYEHCVNVAGVDAAGNNLYVMDPYNLTRGLGYGYASWRHKDRGWGMSSWQSNFGGMAVIVRKKG